MTMDNPPMNVLRAWDPLLWVTPWDILDVPDLALVYEALDYCDVRDLVAVAGTNRLHAHIVRKYMKQRFNIMADGSLKTS